MAGLFSYFHPSKRMTRCSSKSHSGLSLLSTCVFFQPAGCLQLKEASGSEQLSKQYPFTAGIPLGGINSRLKANTRFVIKFSLLLFIGPYKLWIFVQLFEDLKNGSCFFYNEKETTVGTFGLQ